ncbi:hypothetical protein NORO109296_15630 [Nocardiopsis rhodophaea]
MDVHLVGDRGEHPQVGQAAGDLQRVTEGALAALPVDESSGLLRHGRHRQHHVGAVGDRARPQLQADQEGHLGQGRAGEGRVGQVVQVDTGDDQRVDFTGRGRAQDGGGVAPLALGQRSGRPGTSGFGAGSGVGDGAAAGQQIGQRARLDGAALPGPPRDPGEPRAGAVGQPRRGRQGAGRLGEAFADEDDRALGAQRLDDLGLVTGESVEDPRLLSGHRREEGAVHFLQAPVGVRGDRVDARALLPGGLAQPQEDDGRLVLGLEPGEEDGGGGFQVRVAHLDAGAGDAGGEEIGLLL